jgi:hypothetical protein
MANERKRRALMMGEQGQELYLQGHKDLSDSYVDVVTMRVENTKLLMNR